MHAELHAGASACVCIWKACLLVEVVSVDLLEGDDVGAVGAKVLNGLPLIHFEDACLIRRFDESIAC